MFIKKYNKYTFLELKIQPDEIEFKKNKIYFPIRDQIEVVYKLESTQNGSKDVWLLNFEVFNFIWEGKLSEFILEDFLFLFEEQLKLFLNQEIDSISIEYLDKIIKLSHISQVLSLEYMLE